MLRSASRLLILAAVPVLGVACGPRQEAPDDHRVEIAQGTVLVPGDRWARARSGVAGQVDFEERSAELAPPGLVRLTVFDGPLPEGRRLGAQIDRRYWLEATRISAAEIAVVQRFDYGAYWVRTRSTYPHRPAQGAEEVIRIEERPEELLPRAIQGVRPITRTLAFLRFERDLGRGGR